MLKHETVVETSYGKQFTFKPGFDTPGPSQHAHGNQVMQKEFIPTSKIPALTDSPRLHTSNTFPKLSGQGEHFHSRRKDGTEQGKMVAIRPKLSRMHQIVQPPSLYVAHGGTTSAPRDTGSPALQPFCLQHTASLLGWPYLM